MLLTLKNAPHEYEIYGKTYGANKYDTSLICYAISKLAQPQDHIVLYEYMKKIGVIKHENQ